MGILRDNAEKVLSAMTPRYYVHRKGGNGIVHLVCHVQKTAVGSSAAPNGCWPVGTGAEMGDTAPLLRLKTDKLFAATLVT
jgi:hypothetical protein